MSTTSTDNYALVTALHAAEATLVEARLAAARDPARSDAVPALEAAASAARAAVNAALTDGRVVSAYHVSALPWDCLGAIFQRLSPRDVARCEAACPTFRTVAARAATPSAVSFLGDDAAVAAAVNAGEDILQAVMRRLRALAGEPAAAVRSVKLSFEMHRSALRGDLLAAALDAAPGTTHVLLGWVDDDTVNALAARRDRGFSARAENLIVSDNEAPFARLAAAVRVVSAGAAGAPLYDMDMTDAARTLTQLDLIGEIPGFPVDDLSRPPPLRELPHLPHVRRLVFVTDFPDYRLSWGECPWLPAVADLAYRPQSIVETGDDVDKRLVPKTFGDGALWESVRHRLTRLDLTTTAVATNLDLSFVSVLTCLRDLRVDWQITAIEYFLVPIGPGGPRIRIAHPDWNDIDMPPLPRLPPSVTRLVTRGAARFVCGNLAPDTAPGLRVLDRRNSIAEFETIQAGVGPDDDYSEPAVWALDTPRAAAAPALTTVLLGYCRLAAVDQMETGGGVLWLHDVLALAPTLVTVVLERAWLAWKPPQPGAAPPARSPPDQVVALMQGKLPNLRCVHVHSCTVCDASADAVGAFFAGLTRRGVRVCRAPAEACVFGQLLDEAWGEW